MQRCRRLLADTARGRSDRVKAIARLGWPLTIQIVAKA
jgi:hypothetical protein